MHPSLHSSRLVVALLAGLVLAGSGRADPAAPAAAPKGSAMAAAPVPAGLDSIKDAVPAMESWTQTIDAGSYAKSWKDASPQFQAALTQDLWVKQLKEVRTPLGSCTSRKMLSANRIERIKLPTGTVLAGPFIIARFNSNFTNLVGAIETVTFQLGTDGIWRASGYFIKAAGA